MQIANSVIVVTGGAHGIGAALCARFAQAGAKLTKHAAVGFGEALAIAHADQGIGVSVLCPQGAWINMTRDQCDSPQARDGMLQPEAVAQCVVEGLEERRFLILPHPEVALYRQGG